MNGTINKKGIISASIIEGYDKVSIHKDDITVKPNILINTYFNSIFTLTAWDVTKNGNYLANSWGGYNSGVSNPSTVYHAHLQKYGNEYVYNYTKDSDNSWLGISQGGLQQKLEVGKTYTFSCECYRISGTNYVHGGIYTKANSSATSNSFVNSFSFSGFSSISADGFWHHYNKTFTIPSDVYMNSGCYLYIYGYYGGSGVFLMRHPKLELNDISTPWCPNDSDGFGNIYLPTMNNPISVNEIIEY